MINIHDLDRNSPFVADDKDLLLKDPESLRTFYSLTGPARREYIIQIAEAEAERIRIVRRAQAEGIIAIRKAEAEGMRVIGEALATLENPEHVVRLAGLMALQEVSRALADGKATKLFVPQNIGEIFSLIGSWKETLEPVAAVAEPG